MYKDDVCTNCGIHPKVSGYNVCSRFCLDETRKLVDRAPRDPALEEQQLCKRCKQRKKGQETSEAGFALSQEHCGALFYQASQNTVAPTTAASTFAPLSTENTTKLRRENLSFPLTQRIRQRMEERWVSDGTEFGSLHAIYSIQVPNEVYQRFNTALEMSEDPAIVTSYYGGTVTCDIADFSDDEIRSCKSGSCALCNAINSRFNNIPFGEPSHDGVYGPGIYTHRNPVVAHQISVTCSQHGPQHTSHAVVQCRVVTVNDAAERHNSYAGFADELGLVFCTHAVAIIPTHLLIYEVETEFPLPGCSLRGCNKPIPTNETRFCSSQHREDAVKKDGVPVCVFCEKYPRTRSHFCGQRCCEEAQSQAPMLITIDQQDPLFYDVVNQFNTSWLHQNKPKPTVAFVYKIVQTKQLMEPYFAYQNKIESEGNFKSQGKPAGNECRQWHGTKRLCNIGDDPANPTLCSQAACPVCSILRTSFQVSKTSFSGRPFHRFGKGIYTTPVSSKAHDFGSNGGPSSQYSFILLANVIVGKGYEPIHYCTGLVAPPSGYHSVLGDIGGSLNYPELSVYNDDAIRPSWLVVYK